MARAIGSSTERGYGNDHRIARAAAISAYRQGQPCARCGQPLLGNPRQFDLGHVDGSGKALYAGLEHRSCNRAAGARQANNGTRVIMASRVDRSPVCDACGKKYHYAARRCEICGAHYHPSGGQVRTCSRACGMVLHKRNRLANGWLSRSDGSIYKPKPPKPARRCQSCGDVLSKDSPNPCRTCRAVRRNGSSRPIAYYTCRYCGTLGVEHGPSQKLRQVCPARPCQLARLAANNLIVRKGMAREQADAQVAELIKAQDVTQRGRWQQSRAW